MIDTEIDICYHPIHHHPLDPYVDGKIVTRVKDGKTEIVRADERALLGCDLLWDINALSEQFARHGVRLVPPVPKLDLRANFQVAGGVEAATALLASDIPTNRPTFDNPWPICQHWTLIIAMPGRTVGYRVGAFRPDCNAMEVSWV